MSFNAAFENFSPSKTLRSHTSPPVPDSHTLRMCVWSFLEKATEVNATSFTDMRDSRFLISTSVASTPSAEVPDIKPMIFIDPNPV